MIVVGEMVCVDDTSSEFYVNDDPAKPNYLELEHMILIDYWYNIIGVVENEF